MSTSDVTISAPARPASAPAGGAQARRQSRPTGLVPKLIAIAVVLAAWQALAIGPFRDSLPSPVEVVQALVTLMGTSEYWIAVATTLRSWAIGLALCTIIGVPVGLLLGASHRATISTQWIIDFFRTIPTIALLPLILLLFGASMKMEVVMIVLAAIWPLLIQAIYAAKQVEPLLKWVVRVFRLSWADRLRFLWAPSVTLHVFTGMRLAATMALLMAISAEYIGGAPGLGLELSHAEEALNRPAVFAYAVTAAVVGLLINTLLLAAQRRMLWWHPIVRGEKLP